ncbi:GNAT family N-acetyltransferase [Risungbinella massiliensis]|uniref:GNAT family N-acetyltransferase n=1 Tax=Risungbinella massiliensis TaxID=1329796 RepID=UPI0009E37599|nr:GNAT family N-acetyltransferase [Risungbinella massiliensis]
MDSKEKVDLVRCLLVGSVNSETFDFQPQLGSELIEIRPLRAEDFTELYTVASDPLIWTQHPNKNRHEEEEFKAFFLDALNSKGALAVIDNKEDRLIGSSRYHGYNEERDEIEIGWTFLARSHWGGTYNQELKRLMLQHAFKFVSNVIFLIGRNNFRSQRAVEKIGGVLSGSRRDANGLESLVYRIDKSFQKIQE